jgi:hypothetical protein
MNRERPTSKALDRMALMKSWNVAMTAPAAGVFVTGPPEEIARAEARFN